MIALILPSFILSTSDGTLTKTQSFFFSLFTILLYGVFLAVQTIRHRTFFVEPLAAAVAEPKDDLRKHSKLSLGEVGRHTLPRRRSCCWPNNWRNWSTMESPC